MILSQKNFLGEEVKGKWEDAEGSGVRLIVGLLLDK